MDSDELRKSKVFCTLPWVHMHVLPNSKVLPCCVWPYDKPIGDVSVSSMKEIWNSEAYKKIRLDMLNYRTIAECRHCYEVDGAKGFSMRTEKNQRFAHLFEKTVATTKADGTVDNINMALFDIRFSNICNFKCRGCSPELSSAWFNDHEKLYNFKSDKPKYISIGPNPAIWDELMSFIDTVEVAYFAGGEPLIMDDHYRVLDELIKCNKTDTTISYNTNLSKISFRDKSICEYWNKFSYVHVGLSIDDIGERGEYFRHGMNWSETLKNIEYIKKHSPHVQFAVNCTTNAMNVLYITEIHQYLVEHGIINPKDFFSNLLIDPVELRMRVLPPELKGLASTKIKKYMGDYLENGWDAATIDSLNATFLAILQYMNQEDESHLLPLFIDRTQKLDAIRGESFEKTFPELAHFISLNK